jgi:hypothetical protein
MIGRSVADINFSITLREGATLSGFFGALALMSLGQARKAEGATGRYLGWMRPDRRWRSS